MEWITLIIGLFIGFWIGRFYKLFKRFGNFLEQEKKNEERTV